MSYNAITYSKKLQEAGLDKNIADIEAQQLGDIINDELVTKSFLSSELKGLEITIIKWMVGISFAQVALVLGLINFMLKNST